MTLRRRMFRRILCLLLGPVAGSPLSAAPGTPPKLVVVIVVDQMRSDYLDRFSPYFGDKGFQRLIREGRLFTRARYAHATTFTGPGHAVIGSGIYANRSGIVGNRWYSRERREEVYCALGFASAGHPDQCLIGDETDGSTA